MSGGYAVVLIASSFFAGWWWTKTRGLLNPRAQGKTEQDEYDYHTAKFVLGDLVRIKGESHEWAIVQKLDDKKVLLDYNDDGNDYQALLVASERDLELA